MERKDVNENYKWNTADIFSSDEAWQKAFDKVKPMLDFSAYVGKLADGAVLLECLKKSDEVSNLLERLYLYAHMKADEDSRISQYASFKAKVEGLYVEYSTQLAFFEPELLSLDEKILISYATDAKFSDYDYFFKRLIDNKSHVLSAAEENLLALSGDTISSFRDIFTMIDNADLPLPEIEYEGEKVKLSHGLYGVVLHEGNRELRKVVFEKYYAAYVGLINTISATYYGNVKKNVFITRARKYSSCLSRALINEDVPLIVYEKLLANVERALPDLHRYIADRKKLLGYDELHMYDIYAPLVSDAELKLDYEQAYKLVLEGLRPLGEEYASLLKRGYDERWIDVCETEGKRSGAYSTGAYGVHPYVLLNYQKTTHDIFTIAHEMGHSIHTYFSNKFQPQAKADYKIFVAEVASTVNEVLLLKHLLNTTSDESLKKYLLNYYLDMIRTTLFRQTMFAQFEYEAHKSVEEGVPLTKDDMCKIYADLNKKYYGDAVISDTEISYEWARIPHFYSAFYVYKYSTGIISAITIANKILSCGKNAVDKYFKFLSSGGSDSPVELLKIADVDLTTDAPFKIAFDEFNSVLTQFEGELKI